MIATLVHNIPNKKYIETLIVSASISFDITWYQMTQVLQLQVWPSLLRNPPIKYKMWPISVSVSVFTQPRLLTKKLTSVRSLCTFHVCPDASKKSSKMVSQPGRQLREQPRPTVRSLWTFHVCGTSACALMRQKVLRVRQYVRTFGPWASFTMSCFRPL